jgi:cyclic pyranopterin phosphate synthase
MIAVPDDRGLSLRVSVTDRCQLRCSYCMPPAGIPACRHEDILSYEEITRFAQYLQAEFGLGKVRITGGDPLVRKEVSRLVRMLSGLRIPDLAMTTNGQLLEEHAQALKEAGLKRVNVSLDSLVPETFRRLSGGGSLDKSLRGIEAARRAGLCPVKLNMVVLRGVNDGEVRDLAAFALEHDCDVRFLELMPLGVAAENHAGQFVSSEETAARLATRFSLKPLAAGPGGTARNVRLRDPSGREGRAGFISPCSEPFCGGCRRLRLTAGGHLIGCLGRDSRISIKPFLRSGKAEPLEGLRPLVEQALAEKNLEHRFKPARMLGAVGG